MKALTLLDNYARRDFYVHSFCNDTMVARCLVLAMKEHGVFLKWTSAEVFLFSSHLAAPPNRPASLIHILSCCNIL